MAHFISNELSEYIKEKYNIDLEKDENVSLKSYNPHVCNARVWKSNDEYISNAGGYTNYQCNHPKFNGCEFCEVHQHKYDNGELTLGKISEEPPETPYIIDSLGNKNKYYWIHNSEGMKIDEIVRKENEIREIEYKEKKSRGRPPTKKIPYSDIDWADYAKNKKLNDLNLESLREYLKKNNLNIYGKKSDLVKRIEDNLSLY